MLDMPKKLLIVDDDPSILTMLSLYFSELGYCVRSAEDGSSALSEIEKEHPDILLSDIHMPGISGILFLLIVRQNFPSIQVVAMSGAYSGSRVPPGVAADAFYEKGSSLDLLTQAVDAVTQPGRSTIRLSTEDLVGFLVFESTSSHFGTGNFVHSTERSIASLVPHASLVPQKSARSDQSRR